MNTIAVIPARGGSKGIPGKNLKPVAGVPLLDRSILAARRSASVQTVFVTSDDDEILERARRCGAEAIRRPAALASDTATSESALLHALDEIENRGDSPERLVFIQCTSPFITSEDIDGLVASMDRERADCALTVTPFHGFLWKPAPDGLAAVGHDKSHRPRRQDREPVFLETGAVYAMNVEGFRAARHRFFGRVAHHIVEPVRALEIDEPLDMRIANEIARDLETGDMTARLPEPVEALILDFDGVMTDDTAIVSEDGRESVQVSRGDGMGLERLRKLTSVRPAVISKETNKVVAARCEKLKIECIHGVEDKATVVSDWAAKHGVDLTRAVYVGNDLNDLPVAPLVGLFLVPSDARPEAKDLAGGVLKSSGGRGAVREVCEMIIARESGG